MNNKLYLDSASIEDIESMKKDITYSIDISSGAKIEILESLNNFLRTNKISHLSISFGGAFHDSDIFIKDINCLKYLPEVCRLTIFPTDYKNTIEDLSCLEYLYSLNKIAIMGQYKNSISLEPLLQFKESLWSVNIERGLSKKQQQVINQCDKLNYLNVKDLDLALFDKKENLKELYINSNLYSMELLSDKFPVIDKLYLKGCKSTLNLSAIVKLRTLTKLSLFDIHLIDTLPSFAELINLECLNLIISDLKDINNLFEQHSLKKLAIMNLKYLLPNNFNDLVKLKNLETAYLTFKDKKNDSLMRTFIESNGWVFSM